MSSELRDILFLDIETVASTDTYQSLGERLKTQWARKAGFFKQREEGMTDEDLFYERAGIYAEFGKIIVIGVGRLKENENGELVLKTRALFDHDEKKLLEGFKGLLEKMDPGSPDGKAGIKLCAHNGKEFDFPYLSRRMLVQGITLPGMLNLAGKKAWEVPHLDTMELWKFGDYKHYTSLDLLATIFDIPTSKTVMDGSKVNEVYYKEGDLNKIAEYCIGDVVAVAQLFLRLKGMTIIPPDRIQKA
jgi:DNA polymerase elongation subunit (family B)